MYPELRSGDRVFFSNHVAGLCIAVCQKMGAVAVGFSLMVSAGIVFGNLLPLSRLIA